MFPTLFHASSRPAWLAAVLALLACLLLVSAPAQAAVSTESLAQLASGDNNERLEAIDRLGKSGDAQSLAILQALADGRLRGTPNGGVWIIDSGADNTGIAANHPAINALTGAHEPLPVDASRITINNRLRRALSGALATGQLYAPDAATRLAAAQQLRNTTDASLLPMLQQALASEGHDKVKQALAVAQANLELQSPDAATRLHAVQLLTAANDASFRNVLAGMLVQHNGNWAEPDAEVRRAAQQAVAAIDRHLQTVQWLGNLFYGISLGSVLLLAALGLAIIFGLMGVINMAHGELLMIGAYATYLVQSGFRQFAPQWLEWYVVAALPVAFVITACVGMVLERTVIRWLYGRPLETLLATWGISLVLIQAVRSLFGAQNVEVANPGWLSGGQEIMNGLVLSYNRLAVIVFSLLVVAFVWLLLNHTRLGLFVRAITQNRRMAGCVGVATGRVDMLTFGLGAGIAGLAGVALSQLGNVGPDLGKSYIIDSFMVVVLGGVGQLAGTVIAAFGLGSISKFIEPFSGAVLAKIAILVLIVLFIQKRPQGLFAPQRKERGMNKRHRDTLLALNRQPLFPAKAWTALAIATAILAILPLLNLFCAPGHALHVPAHTVALLGKFMCYALAALALDLVWGYAGILSLGHGIFFALGAYAQGMYLMRSTAEVTAAAGGSRLPAFMSFLGWTEYPWYWSMTQHFWWAMLLALAVPGLLAFLFGYFAFRSRIKGVYFSIITQALTFAAMLLFFRNETGFGGTNGFTDFQRILGFDLTAPATRAWLFWITLAVLFATLVLSRLLTQSRYGRVLTAVRDAESRVRFLGYEPLGFKLFVWTISAMLCGLAGALYVPQVGIINPSEMSPANSIEMVIWVATGGRGTLFGPIIGAGTVNGLKTWFTTAMPEYWLYALGALFVIVTIFLPQGMVGLARKLAARRKEQAHD